MAVVARFQAGDPEKIIAGTLEFQDRVSDFFKHPPDLMFSALMQGNLQPGILLGFPQFPNAAGSGLAPAQEDPLFQLPDIGIRQNTFHFNLVDFGNSMPGVHEDMRQRTIRGQEQEPFGVVVQPAHGKNSLADLLHNLPDCGPVMRIRQRRHTSPGLIEEQVNWGGFRPHQPPPYPDAVLLGIGLETHLPHHMAINADLSFCDQFFGLAPRGNSR